MAAARAIGGRVVLKIASDDIAHKSDIGGVALNLQGDDAVADAFRRIMAAAPATVRGSMACWWRRCAAAGWNCSSAARAIRNGGR